jgi:hypothetical protein
MRIPDHNPHIWGYLDPRHTIRGIYLSPRSYLAYGEIANGTSGRQKTWYPCALYRPPLTDHAYHRPGEADFADRWDIVGIIKPTVHRPGQFVVWAHRYFNPQPSLHAKLTVSSAAQARELMELILEKWYE